MILSAQKRAERKGFSLTELMVVVAVIVILAGLVAGVVVKAIDASRTSTSLTTMEVIQSGLTRQLQQVIDEAKKSGKSPEDIYSTVRQAFPKSLLEINTDPRTGFNLTVQPGNFKINIKPYMAYKLAISKAGTIPTELQGSFLLRTILENGPFSKIETDQLPKGAIGSAGSIPIVRDAWGDSIGLEISYTDEENALKAKPVFTLSSQNVAKGGK